MAKLQKLPMRRLSRETAAVLKTLREDRRSMIVTHFGEPVALLTPVLDHWGSPAAPIESDPFANDGESYTETEQAIIRLVDNGITSPDRIAAATGLESREIILGLAQCQKKGAIVRKPWGYVRRTS